jgi:alkanesulfonate monooxygenase SsuD/methylene tetrahydromethanopterin reductase-like flavin-dependent oxidoreductase (luciferase family)
MLMDFVTPTAAGNAVTVIRRERERLGLDPSIPVCATVVTAPELDEQRTMNLTSCRFITYTIGNPEMCKAFERDNGWDLRVLDQISAHPMFNQLVGLSDQSFHRHDLYDVAKLVPESWMRESCVMGSIEECVETMHAFRDAGIDEFLFYGSTPAENAGLVEAWRKETKAPPVSTSAGRRS